MCRYISQSETVFFPQGRNSSHQSWRSPKAHVLPNITCFSIRIRRNQSISNHIKSYQIISNHIRSYHTFAACRQMCQVLWPRPVWIAFFFSLMFCFLGGSLQQFLFLRSTWSSVLQCCRLRCLESSMLKDVFFQCVPQSGTISLWNNEQRIWILEIGAGCCLARKEIMVARAGARSITKAGG